MAGILNSKTRVLDTIITSQGKKDISRGGKFKISYVSFTDRNLYYSTSSDGVLENQSDRIYFEATSTDNDVITYEINPEGSLSPFKTDRYDVYGDKLFNLGGTLLVPTLNDLGIVISEGVESNSSQAQIHGSIDMLSASIDIEETPTSNFKRQNILGTREFYKEDKGSTFKVGSENISFTFSKNNPLSGSVMSSPIENVDPIFQDFRLGNSFNFKFLPPRIKPNPQFPEGELLGNYPKINQNPMDTWEEVQEYLNGKTFEEIPFIETSTSNNVLGQFFEFNSRSGINKLAVIDVGEFEVDGKSSPHVLFAGKLYRNIQGSLVFVNIFTLVFE